jgi:hypothetical protein
VKYQLSHGPPLAFPANLHPLDPSLKTELFDTYSTTPLHRPRQSPPPACHEHLPSPEPSDLLLEPFSLPCNSLNERSSAIDDPPAEMSLPPRSTPESSTACRLSCPKPTLTECANGKRACGPDCRTRLEVRRDLVRVISTNSALWRTIGGLTADLPDNPSLLEVKQKWDRTGLDMTYLLSQSARDPQMTIAFNYASLLLNNSYFLEGIVRVHLLGP